MPTPTDPDEPPDHDAPDRDRPVVRRRRRGGRRLDNTETHTLQSNDSGFALHRRAEILNPDHRQDDDE